MYSFFFNKNVDIFCVSLKISKWLLFIQIIFQCFTPIFHIYKTWYTPFRKKLGLHQNFDRRLKILGIILFIDAIAYLYNLGFDDSRVTLWSVTLWSRTLQTISRLFFLSFFLWSKNTSLIFLRQTFNFSLLLLRNYGRFRCCFIPKISITFYRCLIYCELSRLSQTSYLILPLYNRFDIIELNDY